MSTDIKLSKFQIFKMIQSGRSFGSWLANLRKKTVIKIAILLARDNLHGLISNLISNGINKFEKNNWKSSYHSRKRMYFIYFG